MRNLLSLLLCLLIGSQAFAQGKVAGTVTDGSSSEALIGVSISLFEKGGEVPKAGTLTDIDGNFSFEAQPGTYEVEIKYVGYQPKKIADILVTDNRTTNVAVTMDERKNTELDEVVIQSTLKKESVNALFTMQKNAASVSSGISADLIKRSPDRNTGEVLKRVSGASIQDGKFVIVRGLSDRYNSALINNTMMPTTEPNRKAFSFDIIPSNLIDNLVIHKTATPELPGDFAGGVIQVLTKDAPEENFLNFGISLGYNTESTFKDFKSTERGSTDWLGFESSDRKLTPSFGDNYTYYKGQTLANRINATKELPNSMKQVTSTAAPIQTYQLSWGSTKRFKNGHKLGSILAANYRKGQYVNMDAQRASVDRAADLKGDYIDDRYQYSVNVGALANFTYITDKSKISFKNIYNRIFDEVYYTRDGFSVSNSQQQKLYSSVPLVRGLYNGQLEGEHALGKRKSKLTWNLNYSNLTTTQNDLRTLFYQRYAEYNNTNKTWETFDNTPYSLTDRNSRRFFSTMKDNNYGGSLSYALPFEMFDQKQTLKAGYTVLSRNRDFKSRIFNYQSADPSTFDEAKNTYGPDSILNTGNMGMNGFVLSEFTNPTDAYKVSGLLNAGYLMLDNKLSDKVRLIWGARLEQYTQKINTRNQSAVAYEKKDSYLDILPSLNLVYNLNDKSNLRLSGSRTVSRPEFWEIVPFSFFDFENNFNITGNPDLKRGNITNADLRFETYPSAGEAISATVFFKHFNTPIEASLDPASNESDFITYINSKAATAAGIEVELRKKLSFIGDARLWDNLTIATNLSYIYSNVNLSNLDSVKDRPLQGQSPYIINASLQYSSPETGFGATLLYNRIGERLTFVGNKTRFDVYERGRDILDLQLSKTVFKKNGEVKLTISDILNQPYLFYQNVNDKRTYDPGDKSLSLANDAIFRNYVRGTTFTLSFTYNFKY
ncbi:MAG: TonB-dependent receptor [Taibaiella sp.]|jgi:TonB-dependent receptor